ncbi:hypothetical protein COV82_03740 [Candidatus Peregrinibacteria bacterium CG11_big_fil_rev_8_21_14_0_20_46_8]|nr:MAG: hypothetical protein COV82_03740 [Candidatus Peregrinibacteria bacterium CG11_big_fil_rev_8_21_14_0_20_46_8]
MSESQNQENQNALGPHAPGFLQLVLNTFAGLGGGVAGTIVLFLVFLGASTALKPVAEPGVASGIDSVAQNPLFIFIVIATVFLASLISNIVGSLLFSFVRHDKYNRSATIMYQIFFINLCIFALLTPIYLVLDAQHLITLVGATALLHVAVSAFASLIILEIVGNTKYSLVGVYNVVFGLLIALTLITFFFQFTRGTQTILLFITLPAIWTAMGAMNVIGDMLYRWFYSVWGTDVLSVATDLGGDYGEAEKEEDEEEQLPPDQAGADFLKEK